MEDPLAGIDVARRVLAAMQQGYGESEAEELLAPDVDWYASVGGLEPSLAEGRDAVQAAFERYRDSWARLAFDEEAAIAAGDRVLMLVRESAKGLGSGLTVEQASAGIMTLREGRIAHVVTYLDPARALADLGVPEAQRGAIEPGGTYALREGKLVTLPAPG
jgi:ketosteroid isomerase-like protein